MALSGPSIFSSYSLHRFNPLLLSRRSVGISVCHRKLARFSQRFCAVAASENGVFVSPETEKSFDFTSEERIYKWWESQGYFRPRFDRGGNPFVVSMPPPNVTGSLHMGHAMFVTLEDIMVRYARMRGRPTLWLPGTDHAGIATQMVVEKMLASEGIKRTDLSRDEFTARVWEWKEKYGGTITSQIKRLGASCDWTREHFTLDEELSWAVVEAFIRLHEKGLIYQAEKSKMYLVKWDDVCQPKECGGLGIRRITLMNVALLTKWLWRLNVNDNLLWKGLVTARMDSRSRCWWIENIRDRGLSPVWRQLIKFLPFFRTWISLHPGKGDKTRFWLDRWIGDAPLADRFPNLFSLTRNQSSLISDMAPTGQIKNINWVPLLRRTLHDAEALQFSELICEIDKADLIRIQPDVLIWRPCPKGVYTVSSGYTCLLDGDINRHASTIAWTFSCPKKQNFFNWCLIRERLPTRDLLERRGIQLASNLCPLCHHEAETVNHLLLHCNFSWRIWGSLLHMFGQVIVIPKELTGLFSLVGSLGLGKKGRTMFSSCLGYIPWSIWKERNNRVFHNKARLWKDITYSILHHIVGWLKLQLSFRGIGADIIWKSWKDHAYEAHTAKKKKSRVGASSRSVLQTEF